ncbi:MAG: bifunctional riboflavin kinase/FAD synthetase [Ignavibacteriales bacterium]|nr:bifunctional riboflavin kinase/FAD synthetase [Ignavibacteriales bacterium]
MIVVRSVQELTHDKNSVLTVGTFDGVHLGHRSIIKELVTRARSHHGRSVIVTFEPHPREVVGRGPIKLLTPLEERLDLIGQLAVDITVVLEFTYEFSRQTSQEFYERYAVRGVGVSEVIVGHDHMFGIDREGGIQELQALGKTFDFSVAVVEPVSIDGEAVSSSKIREMLLQGDVERAEIFLGRPYSITGNVVQGDRRGTQIGFPTANLDPVHSFQLIPAEGVYCVSVLVGENQYYGMMNIGTRPTFHTELKRTIEVNIFDFNKIIYGSLLRVQFLKRLRPEKKFLSQDELITQLRQDRAQCMNYITTTQLSEISHKGD